MNSNPKVCVVVPVFNRINFTLRFIEAFKKSTYRNFEIVIVDDGSKDGTSEIIKEKHPDVVLIQGDGNLWWSGGTNKGVEYALENNFDYVLTINNDAVVAPEYLSTIVKCAEENPNSLIGSLILFKDTDKVWSIGGYMTWRGENIFNLGFHTQDRAKVVKEIPNPYPAEILNGDGTLVPVNIFKKIGLYDEKWCPQYHGDSEIVLRARKHGFNSYVCLDAILENDVSDAALIKSKKDLVFSKKSDFYWRPMVKFFVVYAPWTKKIYFFKQYYRFFAHRPFIRFLHKFWTLFRIVYGKLKKWTMGR